MNNSDLLLTVLVAGKAKIMGSFSVWWGLLPGSLCALRVEAMGDLSAGREIWPFYKNPNPNRKGSALIIYSLPKDPSPKAITLRVRFQHVNFLGVQIF